MNADGSLEDSLDNTEVHISRDDEESSYEDTDIDMIEASTPLKTASSATSSAPLPSANVPALTLRVSPRSNKGIPSSHLRKLGFITDLSSESALTE